MNTYGDIGTATAGYYSRMLLEHAMPDIVLERFGEIKPLPKHNTKIIQFQRSIAFPNAVTPLTEGVTPNGSDFGYDTITVLIQQYGDYAEITDVVDETSQQNVLTDIVERQGEQIGSTREALTWDVIRAGTSVTYGGSVTTRATVSKLSTLTASKQRSVITSLRKQKAKMYTKVLSGSVEIGTSPIEASYIAVGNTDLEPVVRDLSGANENNTFIPTSKYGSKMGTISPFELGNFEKVRYVLTADLHPHFGAGATTETADKPTWRHSTVSATAKYDVYTTLFLGRAAFGCIPLKGEGAVHPMVLKPGIPRGGDNLAQRGSAGWKMWFACTVLNEEWMNRLETACPK